MKTLATKLFKYRSYTPLPFLVVMFIFFNASGTSLITGFLVAAAGEFIRLCAVSLAGSETRTTSGVGGSKLVISGPYAFLRNPLYAGNILMYVGIGIMSFALFPFLQITALLFFLFQYYLIVKEEEEFLMKKFGSDYNDYLKNVPSIFPRFTKYVNKNIAQPSADFRKGLKSETRSLQAFGGITLIMVILWIIRNKII